MRARWRSTKADTFDVGEAGFYSSAGVEFFGRVLVECFENVSVDAHRDRDVAVAEAFNDELWVSAERNHERSAGVAEIMRAESFGQASADECRAHHVLAESLTIWRAIVDGTQGIVDGLQLSHAPCRM